MRKLIICKKCKKEKQHFGLKMCSACLRHYKRQTRPSFYLGTCYSEMSRRVKTFDKLRPNYFNKDLCTKEQFLEKFLYDHIFLKLYKDWQRSGFKRKHSPSIDRIDFQKGYGIENLQFIVQSINSVKEKKIKICLKKNNYEFYFESCREAAEFLGLKPPGFCRVKKKYKSYNGYIIDELS